MEDYNSRVDSFRAEEYPMLKDEIYLDHAGTTLYSKSLMERFSQDMISQLYGNPHSGSTSSQLSTSRIEDIRLRALHFFRADPDDFDLVFVANATAGIKLVMEALRTAETGFVYGYHKDSHTSLIGVRESATSSSCLDDGDIDGWLSNLNQRLDPLAPQVGLLAYPAQSNMNGRKLPLSWLKAARIQKTETCQIYSLLDAAALVSTSQLDFQDADAAPDFTVLSFNKIFGFPDLGALIVRKASGDVLRSRRYFGGGTVEMVSCVKEQWHISKEQTLHEVLEDGTLAIHSIMALDAAMTLHVELYESMDKISKHTMFLARSLYARLRDLKHGNGASVCQMYAKEGSYGTENNMQGPTVAFNLRNCHGAWVSNAEFEKLAAVKHIHIRSGGLCNPGGITTALGLSPWDLKSNFSAGFRCGNDNDIMSSGKPTGVIRASLGAMSVLSDIDNFIDFVKEYYMEVNAPNGAMPAQQRSSPRSGRYVQSLSIYPIKSCGSFSVPSGVDWEVRPEGLAWDREWCLVHQGTGQALSQKRYPRMVLLRPAIDLASGMLKVSYAGPKLESCPDHILVPLSADPSLFHTQREAKSCTSRVCGDNITASTYSDTTIGDFFTRILDVPCSLARFPAGGSGPSARHAKAHMQRHQKIVRVQSSEDTFDASAPPTPPDSETEDTVRPILLSNESPILMINKASMDVVNQLISETGGKFALPSVFRANIVIANQNNDVEDAYDEDHWAGLRIGRQEFKMLGSCRRCHMICVDQDTAIKDEEPFLTLAKTRRFDGKIFFGSHMCHIPDPVPTKEKQFPTIRVGDEVSTILNI